MSLILAADTTTAVHSVALCRDDAILAEAVADGQRLHSERLLPTTAWLLEQTGFQLSDIDLLAISIGPGSFTGLRIGAATWKGLAFANDLPLIGVPTLDAMARLCATPPPSLLATVLDARMKEVFAAVYHFDGATRRKVLADRVCRIDALMDAMEDLPAFDPATVALLGDGAVCYRDPVLARWPNASVAAPAQGVPRASAVALEGRALVAAGASVDPALVEPVYLRKSQAEVNREKRLAAAP